MEKYCALRLVIAGEEEFCIRCLCTLWDEKNRICLLNVLCSGLLKKEEKTNESNSE